MTDSGYNQVLVMIDNIRKNAEAAPCKAASAEETCDHLINIWIARHGCPITFQSENGTVFVGKLTRELMRSSQVAQANFTTNQPQKNGLVERQNRTLVSMLRVYCSRYLLDWDRYLPQLLLFYNSKQHSITGIGPHLMLTGHVKVFLLLGACQSFIDANGKKSPNYYQMTERDRHKTSPQIFVSDVIRRQQELNGLSRYNTQCSQARQREKFDKKAAGEKDFSVGDYVWVF